MALEEAGTEALSILFDKLGCSRADGQEAGDS